MKSQKIVLIKSELEQMRSNPYNFVFLPEDLITIMKCHLHTKHSRAITRLEQKAEQIAHNW